MTGGRALVHLGVGFERRRPGVWMPRLILVWALLCCLALLGACGKIGGAVAGGVAKAALGGGGPNVAANGQAGKTNAQVLGASKITDQKLVRPQARTIEQSAGETGIRTERVETITVRNEAPPWVWLLVILGWLMPSPGQISAALRGLFSKTKGAANADR